MSSYRDPILQPQLITQCLENCDFHDTSYNVSRVSKEAINRLELNSHVIKFLSQSLNIQLRPDAEIDYLFTHGNAYLLIGCDRYYNAKNNPDQAYDIRLKVKVTTGRVLEITLGQNYSG